MDHLHAVAAFVGPCKRHNLDLRHVCDRHLLCIQETGHQLRLLRPKRPPREVRVRLSTVVYHGHEQPRLNYDWL